MLFASQILQDLLIALLPEFLKEQAQHVCRGPLEVGNWSIK